MPTPLDRAMNSKVRRFAGMVTAVAAYSIWGTDVFPSEADPKGSKQNTSKRNIKIHADGKDPEDWTADEMRRWLRVRGLLPANEATREELLERVKANLRIPRSSKAPVSQS
ncbi:hypothetical protein N7520_001471 [Penicillium odoratum]|uniref:uncharacterized protein n=1 Tax=Penicillium odoratum TaxID=1167516 RepID=UPI00254987FC|nr:uncharacterized protein N7520_001471 [Penicillium odoratum]KAJ5778225.1 hypothetical protein N7520_001471 [Penicillium odoratum]